MLYFQIESVTVKADGATTINRTLTKQMTKHILFLHYLHRKMDEMSNDFQLVLFILHKLR